MNWDARVDYAVSISDMPAIFEWLACFPGNVAINFVRYNYPGIATLFEIGPKSAFGGAAWILSILLWGIFAMVVLAILDKP